MCGILGVVYANPKQQVDQARLAAARDSMTHRGPDEAGLWHRPGLAMAHRRLKVLDLTHGQQPMLSADQNFAVVYNGEIYNFRELQNHYSKQGVQFHTRCDTEVLFKALNHEGADAIERFNGMFAFAHWDQKKHRLTLARDRLGQKPLYWYSDDEQFVYASELKALLQFLGRKFTLDPAALDQFFARGYILSPRTIFQGIAKLPAGCLLTLDAAAGRWQSHVHPYWDVQPHDVPDDPEAVLDELEELLRDAVRIRLVSDVPIGCLLSGGIDSSLITALAAQVSAEQVQAFTISFDESDAHNELPFAKMVAEHHNCKLHARKVRGDDFGETLEQTAGYFDEPFGNATMFSMRKLAQMARQKMVVVLSGQGGDELTAGYPGRYNWVMQTEAHAADRAQRSLYAPPVDDPAHFLNHSSFLPWTGARSAIFSESLKAQICANSLPFDDFAPFWHNYGGSHRLNRVLYTDVKTNLPDYLVCIEERMTMSVGLEARNPLLDHRVVNYFLSLPPSMKVRDGENKWILKQLAYRHVPREAIDRPKRGFTPPLDLWLTQNAPQLAQIFHETDAQTRSMYSAKWREYLLGGQYAPNLSMAVFYSLMFAVWMKRYGQYVEHVPFAAGKPTPNMAEHPTQELLRDQRPEALTGARWFCQAMNNFEAGQRIRIEGDRGDFYAQLVRSCGLVPVQDEQDNTDGLVVIGEQDTNNLLSKLHATSKPPAAQVLLFVPFSLQDQPRIQEMLKRVAAALPISGQQAVPISDTHAVLISRSLYPRYPSQPAAAKLAG